MKALPTKRPGFVLFRGVRLYRDDLDRVIDMMTQSGLTVTISDVAAQYDSLDELEKVCGRRPKVFTVRGEGENPWESVAVSRDKSYWTIAIAGESHAELRRELEDLIKSRQSGLDSLPLYLIFLASFLVLVVAQSSLLIEKNSWAERALGAGVVGTIIAILLAAYWTFYPGVVLSFKHQAGFLRRNRDQVLLLLTGAIVGVLLTKLTTLASNPCTQALKP